MIKKKPEILAIVKACQITDQAFDYIIKEIRVGVSEKGLASKINAFFKANEAKKSFPTIVAFGKNAFEIHHKPTNLKLPKAALIMMDFGAKVDNFCSDMTRTIFFGRITSKQKRVYMAVYNAQQKAANSVSENIPAAEVDQIARKHIKSLGFLDIPHLVGHGVGKKVHERPSFNGKQEDILKPSMIFTIEPGIYIKGFGGVRIEDTYLLKRNGLKQLTKSSKELTVIK